MNLSMRYHNQRKFKTRKQQNEELIRQINHVRKQCQEDCAKIMDRVRARYYVDNPFMASSWQQGPQNPVTCKMQPPYEPSRPRMRGFSYEVDMNLVDRFETREELESILRTICDDIRYHWSMKLS